MLYMIFSSVNFCINTGFASHSWNILLWLVCCESNFPPLRSSFPYLLSDSEIIIDYVCVDVDFFQASPFLPTSSVCTPSKYFERPRLWPVSVSGARILLFFASLYRFSKESRVWFTCWSCSPDLFSL